jgi:hypothetical protein
MFEPQSARSTQIHPICILQDVHICTLGPVGPNSERCPAERADPDGRAHAEHVVELSFAPGFGLAHADLDLPLNGGEACHFRLAGWLGLRSRGVGNAKEGNEGGRKEKTPMEVTGPE